MALWDVDCRLMDCRRLGRNEAMSGGMQELHSKTALKAAITAALKAETVGKGSGSASTSGSVDELKEVIASAVARARAQAQAQALMQVAMEELTGWDQHTATATTTEVETATETENENRSVGNIVSERRQSICNVIFGDDERNCGNGNSNDNGSIDSSSGGLFSRIFRRVDRLLRRWLPGYNYLRGSGGSDDSADLSLVIVGNESGNANENDYEDTFAGVEVASEEPLHLAQVQVQRGRSFSTMSGHRNKWMSNDIYLSGGITRAEFSAHLEGILQKRMLKENQETVLYLQH
ncbi:uncharacterized protein LOC111071948 [Drosophila obscura]|uniref:uncharacterized protein LOC111071948 n=1 Tax=Drosophila obscura TaxID=7282 RepID=UPI001BB19190|nr:uncharacterized protein LOC111071948 [Drosophila obscura]